MSNDDSVLIFVISPLALTSMLSANWANSRALVVATVHSPLGVNFIYSLIYTNEKRENNLPLVYILYLKSIPIKAISLLKFLSKSTSKKGTTLNLSEAFISTPVNVCRWLYRKLSLEYV